MPNDREVNGEYPESKLELFHFDSLVSILGLKRIVAMGWGPYYLIGLALGPEVGVCIGLCFFLGNAVAVSIKNRSSIIHQACIHSESSELCLVFSKAMLLGSLEGVLKPLPTGASHLLAAIANDDILHVLNRFKVADGSEPHIATFFTSFLCIACVVIGNLDLISPTITMFYLLCNAGVNLSCFLLDLLDAPRWKFHHWSLSLLGASLCIVVRLCSSKAVAMINL
ncbi:hypothetical protein L1987_16421 [Smallanthus sonchifolius]|uniref:Uncharacterized protein n=1 Tax=Smallanthus sonchifolius TaxID=185202 RepID=A0ACB9JBS6_9ASTR|nr:hypothetical protein L1987_16421 [Smallanthus sonchifolius]